ncbi:MAG: right-handed parallel beta-helix repeat-containing protein [Thermoplasmata archaeon]|nr:MAG: right-handed parallel beta-helix repeat-containing protein [Thermoplasmata archaeon]
MNRKIVAVWITVIMMVSTIVIIVEIAPRIEAPTTWYVDDSNPGPGDGSPGNPFKTIQAGVDNATPGDTVYVFNGTYYENLVVNKTINLTGEDRHNTIIDGGGNGDVVYINVSWVNITGFTVTNGGCGIILDSSSNNNITHNNISSNTAHGFYLPSFSNNNIIIDNNFLNNGKGIYVSMGIYLSTSSDNNIIANNNFSSNYGGILIDSSSNTNITNNNVLNNEYGIVIDSSENNIIMENNISFNKWYGIEFSFSSNNSIINNSVTNNDHGIYLYTSSNNILIGNNVSSNGEDGIYLYLSSSSNIIVTNIASNSLFGIYISSSSNNNTVMGNNISKNFYGIFLHSSSNNNVTNNLVNLNNGIGLLLDGSSYNNIIGNTFSSNKIYGIYLVDSSNNNTFHHNNIINNVNQTILENTTCFDTKWDDGNGKGNYWSDYKGVDDGSNGRTAGDGVGDTEIPHPYTDQGDGYYQLDNYPLIDTVGDFILLYEGWNLISIPMIQSNKNLGIVLSSITDFYNSVQWYNTSDTNDPWKHNHTGKPQYLNDLNSLDNILGFWIYITEPDGVLFEYSGTQPTQNQTITLHPGWNMVGYPSLSNHNRTVGMNNLTFGDHVDAIWTYDSGTLKWEKMGESDYFKIGRGYYIHAKTKCEWEVPL